VGPPDYTCSGPIVLKCPLAHVPAAKSGGIVAIRIKEAALGLSPNRLETSTVPLKEPRNRTFTKARVLRMFSAFWRMANGACGRTGYGRK
jgi:hypothetical protein